MKDKLTLAREIINGVDEKMAELFVERMKAAELVAEYKKEHDLPILDSAREDELIRRNSSFIEDDTYKEYYVDFQKSVMSISRSYQAKLIGDDLSKKD